jgi:Skp family chaperone for outer membrane proteins
MGEEEKKTNDDRLAGLRSELLDFRSAQSKELDAAREEVRKKVLTEAKEIIAAVAREKGYSIVLWKDVLAYGPPEYDLTDEVVRRFTEGGN